jgi:CheY-like chemotaxis protein
MNRKRKILVVDDEEFNLDNISFYLTEADYDVIGAEDGAIGLKKLRDLGAVDAIVLDRIMPNVDGMTFLAEIKRDAKFADIPVVMQTAASEPDEVLEGIRAGVYYYLTKPYEQEMLLGIVACALRDAKGKKDLKSSILQTQSILGLMVNSCFRFRTIEEAKNLAAHIAKCFPIPEKAIYGLHELLINAVEHGNLGITYAEKTRLILDHCWEQEVNRRLESPECRGKCGYLSFETTEGAIVVTIKDEGAGFNWKNYLDFSAERMTDLHGRGIASSRLLSFDNLEYLGAGNEVRCTVALNGVARPVS